MTLANNQKNKTHTKTTYPTHTLLFAMGRAKAEGKGAFGCLGISCCGGGSSSTPGRGAGYGGGDWGDL